MSTPFNPHAAAGAFVSRRVAIVFLCASVTELLRATQTLSAQTAAATVTIDNFTFSPEALNVAAGTTVTWLNRDDIPHTVVAKDRTFRSKALDTEDSYSLTFAKAGTFDYFCSLHPHMTGRIIVTA